MLAYDYPILGLFWTMLMIFLWIAWLMLLFRVFADIFRSDMSGASKALWLILVVVLPLIGVVAYLIAKGDDMAGREIARVQQNQADLDAYIRSAAGSTSPADELTKLADLHARGVLNDGEFEQQKAKLLA
jgi:hypothetical protein